MYSTRYWALDSPALFWILSTTEKKSVRYHSRFTYVVLYFAVIFVNLKYLRPEIKAITNDEKYLSLINAGTQINAGFK